MVVWTFAVEYFWCLLWQFCHQQPLKKSSHRKEYTIYDKENRRGNPEKPATLEKGRRQTKQNTQHNTEKLLIQIISMTMHQVIIIWPIKPISVFYILNKCCSDLTIYIFLLVNCTSTSVVQYSRDAIRNVYEKKCKWL